MRTEPLPIHSDAEIVGGTPVFVGTRVPVQTFVEYLQAGDPLDEFLLDFPPQTPARCCRCPPPRARDNDR
ncbi:MAG: DUF433 domain-containing protein, partial [Gemmatimonadaceae bacterium]